jgi:hypothetical protein
MDRYSNYLEYRIIFGGAPETVFRKLGLEPAQDCGCEYMETLQEKLDSIAEENHVKWGMTQASSEIYCCTSSPAYDELKSFGRPPKEGTVLIEAKFKNKSYLHEIEDVLRDELGVELTFLDRRLEDYYLIPKL